MRATKTEKKLVQMVKLALRFAFFKLAAVASGEAREAFLVTAQPSGQSWEGGHVAIASQMANKSFEPDKIWLQLFNTGPRHGSGR